MRFIGSFSVVFPCAFFTLVSAAFRLYPYISKYFFLFDGQPHQQPIYLARRDLFCFCLRLRPLEPHVLHQLLACQDEAISVISQYLQRVSLLVAKEKYAATLKGVQMESAPHQRTEPGDLLAKVCGSAGQVDVCRPIDESAHHSCLRTCMTRLNVSVCT